MEDSNKKNDEEMIPLSLHNSTIRDMAGKVAALEARLKEAEQNELVLWRTFGPVMMDQINKQ